MKKVPLAKKMIFNSRKTEKNCPIRKQHHRNPFFFSKKRERKWRFYPPGLRRLPFPSQKKKFLNSISQKSFMALRLKKPGVPFQSLTRIVERSVAYMKYIYFNGRRLVWINPILHLQKKIGEAESMRAMWLMLTRKD